eukprot:SAG11_NODE_7445_length_1143_cov_1.116858_1_plen_91_part_01
MRRAGAAQRTSESESESENKNKNKNKNRTRTIYTTVNTTSRVATNFHAALGRIAERVGADATALLCEERKPQNDYDTSEPKALRRKESDSL